MRIVSHGSLGLKHFVFRHASVTTLLAPWGVFFFTGPRAESCSSFLLCPPDYGGQVGTSPTVRVRARHLEVVILTIAFVQDERPIVGDRVPFERRDLPNRRDFCALGYLLFV